MFDVIKYRIRYSRIGNWWVWHVRLFPWRSYWGARSKLLGSPHPDAVCAPYRGVVGAMYDVRHNRMIVQQPVREESF